MAVAVASSAVSGSLFGTPHLRRMGLVVVDGRGGRGGALTTARASAEAEADAAGSGDGGTSVGKVVEASVPVEKLPLESKVKEMTEQRLRMRMAKKIRLRRKRLLRKRKLRKKGRWPPSKMKKLKNV
ncbi:hypothetical protein MLD38_030985 [Melastoma candidum]|uniref:Uncharacterized protein n=1 Tax=Melastoma candidum TaxID=119954 RepID=A0ACB9MMQ3_9MYRT|nr:hypothetical protein MLD38_030985 [Melastoma candidum]